MFEDVFEPLDDILGDVEKADEWDTGEVWDTGEKEDVWRSAPVVGGVWSVDPKDQTVQPKPDPSIPTSPTSAPDPALPEHDQNDEEDCGKECEAEDCGVCENTEKCDKDSGLFDDLFLDIF